MVASPWDPEITRQRWVTDSDDLCNLFASCGSRHQDARVLSSTPPIRLVEVATPHELHDLADDDLMVLTKVDREDAFEMLMRRHQPLVFGLATRFFSDKTLGRDVAQDVFLSLWSERNRYRATGKFRSYLVSVTLHRCHMVARQGRNQSNKIANAGKLETANRDESLPLDALVERERAQEMRRMLNQVPAKHRQVLILRFTHDFSLGEIAESTGLPVGTVKSHLFRGLKKLRRLMGGTAS